METTTAFSSIEVYSVVGGTRNDQVMSLDIETNSNNTVPTNTNTNTEKKTTGNNQGAKFDYQLFIKKVCMDVFLLLQGESKTPVSKYLKLAAKDWRHSVPYWAHNILGWIISLIANTNVFVGVFSYLVSTMQDEKYTPDTCPHYAPCSDDYTGGPTGLCTSDGGSNICPPVPYPVFFKIEFVVTIIFTIELGLRFLTLWAVNPRQARLLPYSWLCTHTKIQQPKEWSAAKMYFRFLISLRTIIDLLIIIPFYVAPYGGLRGLLYVFRVFRIFRIFSIANKFNQFDKIIMVLVLTYWSCGPALLVLGICCLTIMIFFGSIMFLLEAGVFTVNNQYPTGDYLVYLFGTGTVPSSFTSIPATMYYVATTITTVGYGDIYPITLGGRYLAVLLFYAGLITLALPIAIASSSFLTVLKTANLNEEIEIEENAIIYHENVPLEEDNEKYDTFHEAVRQKMDLICRLSRKDILFDRKEFTNEAFFKIEQGYPELIAYLDGKLSKLSENTVKGDDGDENILGRFRKMFRFEKSLDLRLIAEELKKFKFKALCDTLFNHFDCNFDRFTESIISVIIYASIILAVTAYVVSTMESLQYTPDTCDKPACENNDTLCPNSVICAPVPYPVFDVIELACIVIFSVDYGVRLFCAWAVGPEQNRVSIYAFEKKAKISLSDRATLRHWNKEIAAESRPKFGYEEVAQPYDLTDNPMSISAVSTSTTPVTATATATTAEESTTVERQRGSSRPSGVDRRRSQVNRPSIALQHEGANPNELHGFIPTWLGGQPFEENRHFSKLEFYIRYIFSIRSLIDIACIMPSYIAYAGTSQGRTSFIRVLRILRIFKLITATKSIMRIIFIVNMSLQRSKDAFIILLMASFAVAIFAGSIMYTIEQGQFVVDSNYPNGYYVVPTINQVQTQQSLWQNAFVGAYFSAVTLTTVGYGDVTPTTGGGRLLAVCIQLAGNLLLALPVGVIGANFVDLYALHESQPPESLSVIVNSDSQAKTHSVDYAGTYEITDETSEGQPVYVLYDRTSYKSGGSNRRVMKKYALLYSEDRWKITYFGYRSTDHFLACLKCPGGTTCYGGAAKPYVWVAATSDYAGNVIVSPAPHMTVIETV